MLEPVRGHLAREEPAGDELVDFDEDGCGDNDRLARRQEHTPASVVGRVAPVE